MTGLFTVAGAMGLVAKATLVLAVALVLAWLARRGSARTLHLLWTTTFAVLLVLPGLSLLAPSWVLPIIPARTLAVVHDLPDEAASARSAIANLPSAERQPQSVAPLPTRNEPGPTRADGSIPLTPAAGVFFVWALGCGVGLVSLAAAALRFRKLVRSAVPIYDPGWIRSTDALRHRLRVRADARILSSALVATPMTGGPLRPVVLLPASAGSWTSGRREMVVSHELVHVRRRDALWRFVGGAVVALYWFHPLIWLASRLAAAARERSCDEEVLTLGMRPSDYARHLFSLASEISPGPPVLSLPVVQRPHLETRIMSILKLHRPRYSRVRTHIALAVVGGVGLVAACATPVHRDPAASPTPRAETARPSERPPDQPVPPERVAPPGDPAPAAIAVPAPAPALVRTVAEPPAAGPIRAAPAVPEALEPQEIECSPGRFTGIRRDRESTTVQVSVDGMSLCMRTSGDVVMTGEGTAVAGMDPGSWLVLASQAERLHRMAITSGPSGLEYDWSIDGRSRPFDDEARDWRNLMLTVLARSQEAWQVRRQEASLRREIAGHERHVAGLHREIAGHERHVAGLHREIAGYERHVAGLHRETAGHERSVARLQQGMARVTSAETQEALRATTRALAQLDLQELEAVAQALVELEELDEVRLSALDEDVRRMVRDALRLREEAQNEFVKQLTSIQVEIVRAEGEMRSARQAVERYDLDRRMGEITQEIEQYDLDGKIRDIEAQIDEWDADRRAEEIERSVQDDIAALRRLIHANERSR